MEANSYFKAIATHPRYSPAPNVLRPSLCSASQSLTQYHELLQQTNLARGDRKTFLINKITCTRDLLVPAILLALALLLALANLLA